MSKDSPVSERKQLNLYISPKRPDVTYKVVKRPLQGYVSTARKAICLGWSRMSETVRTSVSSVRHKVQDQLVSLGVKNPVRVMQAGAVGTATLLGLAMARNKSVFRRVLYPFLAGSTVWGVIHFSDHRNRNKVSDVVHKEFSENFNREFSKHFPREYWKHLPKEMREEMKKHRKNNNEEKSD